MDINKLFVIRKPYNPEDQIHDQRDLLTQVAFSSLLGLGAFFAFCVRSTFILASPEAPSLWYVLI